MAQALAFPGQARGLGLDAAFGFAVGLAGFPGPTLPPQLHFRFPPRFLISPELGKPGDGEVAEMGKRGAASEMGKRADGEAWSRGKRWGSVGLRQRGAAEAWSWGSACSRGRAGKRGDGEGMELGKGSVERRSVEMGKAWSRRSVELGKHAARKRGDGRGKRGAGECEAGECGRGSAEPEVRR